jgi:hypothetical protein
MTDVNMSNNVAFAGLNSTNNSDNNEGSWFEAMAEAWGQALDRQATKIEDLSTNIGDEGADTPSAITELTAESLKMTFVANSSHTAISSVGGALDTMARKQ